MKNLHNTIGDFYIPENKLCCWVRDTMHNRRQNRGQQDKVQSYIYAAVISKPLQNTLPK